MARTSTVIRRGVKTASAAADRLRPVVPGVVVLLYHRVGGGSSLEIDLDAAVFEEQIATIAASNRAVRLGDALRRLATPGTHESAVVVTFDDGTADFADVAVPILARHGVPATLYLATAFVEEERELPGGGRPVSWSALRDACSTGLVDVGSHTHTHRCSTASPGPRRPPSSTARSISSATGSASPRSTSRTRRRWPPAATWSGSCATGSGRPRSRAPASTRT